MGNNIELWNKTMQQFKENRFADLFELIPFIYIVHAVTNWQYGQNM